MNRNRENTIPDNEQCSKLMERYEMLPNIVEHSRQVMRVALAIAGNLRPGIRLNTKLISAAALLHDITKTQSLTTGESHSQTGGELLRNLGYHEIAEIVEEHVFFRDFSTGGKLLEKEIVYYADKRVLHDTIVTVEERIDDLVIRYGTTPLRKEMIIKNKTLILQIEEKIQGHMTNNIDSAIEEYIKSESTED